MRVRRFDSCHAHPPRAHPPRAPVRWDGLRRPRGNHLGRAKGRGLDYVRREWGDGTETPERERERPKQDDRNKSENPLRLRWVGGGSAEGIWGPECGAAEGPGHKPIVSGRTIVLTADPGARHSFSPTGLVADTQKHADGERGSKSQGRWGKEKGPPTRTAPKSHSTLSLRPPRTHAPTHPPFYLRVRSAPAPDQARWFARPVVEIRKGFMGMWK